MKVFLVACGFAFAVILIFLLLALGIMATPGAECAAGVCGVTASEVRND